MRQSTKSSTSRKAIKRMIFLPETSLSSSFPYTVRLFTFSTKKSVFFLSSRGKELLGVELGKFICLTYNNLHEDSHPHARAHTNMHNLPLTRQPVEVGDRCNRLQLEPVKAPEEQAKGNYGGDLGSLGSHQLTASGLEGYISSRARAFSFLLGLWLSASLAGARLNRDLSRPLLPLSFVFL